MNIITSLYKLSFAKILKIRLVLSFRYYSTVNSCTFAWEIVCNRIEVSDKSRRIAISLLDVARCLAKCKILMDEKIA